MFIHFRRFVAVSITGEKCWLNCSFCRGYYLKGMISADRPERLYDLMSTLVRRGVRGFLISGGFTKKGFLPVVPFLKVIEKVKKEYGDDVFISMHPGLAPNRGFAEAIASSGVELVDYEFTTDPWMIQGLRGLVGYGEDAYVRSLILYMDAGLRVVPHVMLMYPGFSEEKMLRDLRVLADLGLRAITILYFIPTPGTPYEGLKLELRQALHLLRTVRSVWRGEVYLGCMRPFGLKPGLDRAAVHEGLVDRIANPYHELLRQGYPLYDACCSVPDHRLSMFRVRDGATLQRI